MAAFSQGGPGRLASVPLRLTEQQKTPYLDALIAYVNEGVVPFHVPGHKQGAGIHKKLQSLIGPYLKMDLTEVEGLDNLSSPAGVLKEAQTLAAKAYGVDRSYFLVNGSSSGLHTMFLSVCNPGDPVLLPRNAHKSAYAGLILSGAAPVYMKPVIDQELHVDHTLSPETLRKALDDNPKAKAVLLVSPTYYGVSTDVKSYIEMIHAAGKIAMVDEAWGPHLHFHPSLPMSAVDAGADLVINSTHKILSSLTQTSILHLSGNRIDRGRLEAALHLLLTTSPNCLLLASIDACRMQMATEGKALLARVIELALDARKRINQISGVRCIGSEIMGKPGVYDLDPTKLMITAIDLGYNGYELERYLRKAHHVQVEMSDLFNVMALVTIGDNQEKIDRLVNALKALPKKSDRIASKKIKLPDFPPLRLTPREAFVAPHERVSLKNAVGRISSELITTYPPGIPDLIPGEEITAAVLDYFLIEKEAGSRITGASDPTLETIRVVK